MYTLRNFHTLINHCIEWARDNFDGYFVNIMKELKKFREIKEEYFKQSEKFHNYYEKIYDIKKVIEYTKFIINKNYDDCIEIAFNEYFKTFNNNII